MDTPKITEKEIAVIKRAKAGDESAFTWLFNNYKTFVETQLNLYFNDMDEARDFTNEVFLKVYQNLSKFTQYSSFGGWLRILTKNMAIDYLRIMYYQWTMMLPELYYQKLMTEVKME